MKSINLYQFNADPRLPVAIRKTLLETFEFCNTRLRPYYKMVAASVLDFARRKGLHLIVELGAGQAPLTRLMVEDPTYQGLRFVACDLVPSVEQYRALQQRYPERVTVMMDSVDFTKPHSWGSSALVVLCSAIHHVPTKSRDEVIRSLSDSAGGVMIFSPVRKTWLSLLLSMSMVFPALALPIILFGQPGTLRRLLWCWLIPLVPLIAFWDGLGGVLRQWDEREWRAAIVRNAGTARTTELSGGWNWQMVAW